MSFYNKSIEDVLRETSSSENGLTSEEAEIRLKANGKNVLKTAKKQSLFVRFLNQLKDPMIIILLVAAAISAVLAIVNNESFTDVFIILIVVILNGVLGVYQENKAEKALEALQEMAAPTSKVLRDGHVQVIKTEDIVVGDIIVLEAGDAVPADGRIIESASLKIEEAALTGESVPVSKYIDVINLKNPEDRVPLGDRRNMVYMGSTVVYGRGKAVITETGMNTEMGKIADALITTKDGQTPLQIKLAQLSKILTWLVLIICIVIFGIQVIRAGSFDFKEVILPSFMIAVSLAVAAIPEGLAAVVTVVLSVGVSNMSKRNAIIRKLTAVETLGCTQIICSDKTGTLTQNKMTVVDHFGEDEKLLSSAMALCSDAEVDQEGNVTGEPTEAALVAWAYKVGCSKLSLKEEFPRIGEAPFDSGRKMMSSVHRKADGKIIQYTKGAPDVVINSCTTYLENGQVHEIDEEYRQKIREQVKQFADRALRVLACAQRNWGEKTPDNYESSYLEKELCFVGLAAMIDPVRPEVKAAIDECREAGVRPIMITGDHLDTAIAIAKELTILEEDHIAVSGVELDKMSDEELEKIFQKISVYARVQPEHKTRIVSMWEKAGYITAMTGDGVNDAPSIKAADIGVGMGITGTDVTKNVADMVLADDNFATIVSAVEEGRRIYDNIRKTIQFLLGSNISEVLSIFFATILGFTILKPVHLLWINLITDCFPALALGMERAEPNIMRRKPRKATDGVFANHMGIDIAIAGIAVTVLILASYFIGHFLESGRWEIVNSPAGTTMAFITMSMAEIFHSFNMRSRRISIFKLRHQNKYLIGAAVLAFIATTLVTEIPFIADIFGFTNVDIIDYLIAIGLGILIIPIIELVKFIQRKTEKRPW